MFLSEVLEGNPLQDGSRKLLLRNIREKGSLQSLSDPAIPFLLAWSKNPHAVVTKASFY